MDEQKKKLPTSLVLVVENLRRPEVLGPTLEKMGERHAEYGAEEEHYPAVGAALLKSLAEIAGDAWTDAYGEISKLMLAGAAMHVA